jgi:tetratricopeptide (TPR) repeat protein
MKSIVLLFLILSTISYSQDQSNLIPMYGDSLKHQHLKFADQQFIDQVMSEGMTRENTCKKYAQFGWNYLFYKDYETAIKRFNQAWLIFPSHYESYYGFWACEMLNGRNAEAEKYFQMAERRNKDKSITIQKMNVLTGNFYRRNDKGMTMILCHRMLSIDSSFLIPYSVLSDYYKSDSNLNEALRYLELGLTKKMDTELLYKRACIYQNQKKFKESIQDFSKCIELEPLNLHFYANRGLIYFNLGEYTAASKDFEHLTTNAPKNEKGYYFKMLAKCYIQLNQLDKVCDLLKKAKKYKDNLEGNEEVLELKEKYCN